MISPTALVLQRERLGLDSRHADFGEKIDDPTDNDQFPGAENQGHPADGEDSHHDERFEGISPKDGDQRLVDRHREQDQEREAQYGSQKPASIADDHH